MNDRSMELINNSRCVQAMRQMLIEQLKCIKGERRPMTSTKSTFRHQFNGVCDFEGNLHDGYVRQLDSNTDSDWPIDFIDWSCHDIQGKTFCYRDVVPYREPFGDYVMPRVCVESLKPIERSRLTPIEN